MRERRRRLRRSQRVAAIAGTLLSRPGRLFSLGYFETELGAAKSTISEDIAVIREVAAEQGLGTVETVAGAAGGVRYFPFRHTDQIQSLLEDLSRTLGQPDRILPGGYVYMTDLVFDPTWAQQVGECFATAFAHVPCDAVVTVETRGIPIALMTARALGKPMVTCRRGGPATEGTTISISYVSGSARTLQTMSLPRRALPKGARVLFIDDFLKGGGTARGVVDLMDEFGARVVGTGILAATREPEQKRVGGYVPLVLLDKVDPDTREITARPNEDLMAGLAARGEGEGDS